MLKYKEISIEDKPILDKFIKPAAAPNSEACFTTIFSWRKSYNIKYAVEGDFLFLRAKHGDSPLFSQIPIGRGDMAGAIERVCEAFTAEGNRPLFQPVTKEKRAELEKILPGKLSFRPLRDSFDYVYKTNSLITLAGRKLHSKRNHLNRFLADYEFEYETIGAENIEEIIAAARPWFDDREGDTTEEWQALTEIMNNFSPLGLSGGAIRVNGRVIAFSVGELLTPDTALIHIEKADPEINGAYNIINQQFAANAWADTEYINREEDMGIEGLRRAKLSYKPEFFIEKYCAKII